MARPRRRLVVLCIALPASLLVARPATAQTPGDTLARRAAPLAALRPGMQLRITLTPAARRTSEPAVRRAVLRAVRVDSLRVKLYFAPEERTFAVRQLTRVDTLVIEYPRSRNIRNGVIVGAAFGPLAGISFAKFLSALCEWECPSRRQVYVSGIATGVVAGALVGGMAAVLFPRQTEWARVYP